MRAAALLCRDVLAELGLRGYPKTTGNNGLHVYLRLEPRWDSVEVRAAAVALARELERRHPEQITANWWKEERGSRVFVDFNQNAPHKTVFGAWFARPRTGGQVSTPLTWEEVETVAPDELTIRNVPDLVRRRGDPWADIATRPQSLEPLLGLAGAGQGGRVARRTVAAAVPQDARRAAPRRAEPGQEGVGRWTRFRLSSGSRSSSSAGAPTRTRCGPSGGRPGHSTACRLTSWPRWHSPAASRASPASASRRPRSFSRRSRGGCPTTWPRSRARASPTTCSSTARPESSSSRCAGQLPQPTPTGLTGAVPSPRWPRRPAPLGHQYWALTDHSPRLTVAHGLNPERLRRQLEVVAALNEEMAPFRILTGIEVDILEDGSLDQDEDLLARLDIVVASVHSKLSMDAEPHDPADGGRHREPPYRHPGPLHRTQGGGQGPLPVPFRRRGRLLRPAPAPARRWRSTPDPSGTMSAPEPLLRQALDLGCLVSPSTPTPTPPVSSSG